MFPPPRTDLARVLRWLNGIRTATRAFRKTPGHGDLYDVQGRDFTGSALVWEGGMVHLGLLPAAGAARPEPPARLITPDQRRQRLGR